MTVRYGWGWLAVPFFLLVSAVASAADSPAERQSVEEVRNTVINLLQALVDRGLLTRDQAEQMVKQAQQKAAADAAALAAKNAATEKEEQNAVRVPYVPQIVKDEISKEVAAQVQPTVVASVVKEAKDEGWGIPAALPEWLSRVRMFGEVTVRGQADWYPKGNSYDQILDYNAINQAGGIGNLADPFLDTTENRYRLRLRARLGAEADLSPYVTAVVRLSSGSLTDPSSASQTLGTYGARYSIGLDEGFIMWNTAPKTDLPAMTLQGGRLANPWFAPTQLVYANDLTFEGVADTLRFAWGEGGAQRSHAFLTAGAFPVLEVPLENSDDKWLVGAQLGTNLRFTEGTQRLYFAVAYYDFVHVNGQQNATNSTLLNYTAPAFIRYGNSVFDIANSTTSAGTSLWGLASKFRLVDVAATYERAISRYSLAVTGEAVRNIGYNLASVEALTGEAYPNSEDKGYVGEVSFGDPIVDQFGRWRAAVGYRYVKRDAVIDAWTDADFHEGGTNAAGYYLWGEYGVGMNTWVRLRYLSGNEIDGPRYADDILQLDVTAHF